jgi:hypothetical protein
MFSGPLSGLRVFLRKPESPHPPDGVGVQCDDALTVRRQKLTNGGRMCDIQAPELPGKRQKWREAQNRLSAIPTTVRLALLRAERSR